MLKAGALYLSIITAFLIAVICASLIMIAAHFRAGYLKDLRMGKLYRNMDSAISLVLSGEELDGKQNIDLFGDETDSVMIESSHWGIFALSSIRCFVSSDTLSRAFLTGLDTSQDRVAVYLSDEDRPVSVSGNTRITGDVKVPKSGIRSSYSDGKPYTGKKIVYGAISDSKRTLDGLVEKWLSEIEHHLDTDPNDFPILISGNQNVSFLSPPKAYHARQSNLSADSLSGQIVLYTDTLIRIGANAHLDNVVIYAKSIIVEDGFSGNAQLFARDSIIVGNGAKFTYPSVLAVMAGETTGQSKIQLGKKVQFDGIILTHEQKRSALQTMISLAEGTVVRGEVYATGLVKLDKQLHVFGKVSCNRFIMQTSSTMYENFLIDITLNRKARSGAYLSSGIFKGNGLNKKILRWQQ